MDYLSSGLKAHDLACTPIEFLQHFILVLLEFVPEGCSSRTPEIVAINTPFSWGLWIVANSSLKHLTYTLRVSFSPCLILVKWLNGVAYFLAPWNWCMNSPESCIQEVIVLGSICLNHFLVAADSVTAKHLHHACDETWSRSIWSLKASRWSWGYVFPS